MAKDSNIRFWERFARLYGPIQERSNRALYDAVTKSCTPYITADTSVLELACGSGQLTLPLWQKAKYWEATDFSPKMLRELSRRCPGVPTSVQDATALTYEDSCFDVVIIANALHIMPEPEKALREIRRVLKRDGVMLCPTFVYEGKVNRFRMRLTEAVGFRSYFLWTMAEMEEFLNKEGFRVTEAALLPGSPLPEGFVAARPMP